MKSIIVATDFSVDSLNAVDYAADMALFTNAQLNLIHVYPMMAPVSEVPVPLYSIEDMEKDALRELLKLKSSILDRLRDRIIIHVETRPGNAVSGIKDYCDETRPFAVVMGPETADTIERVFFGAKTLTAIRELSWPLIIVPKSVKFSPFRKIGLACDLKEVVKSVHAKEIIEFVKEFNASLHVVNVSDIASDKNETVEQTGLLQEMLGELDPKYHFLTGSEIEKGLVRFAEANDIDLLIIIPKKHTLIARLLQKSHSVTLAENAIFPLMAIHE